MNEINVKELSNSTNRNNNISSIRLVAAFMVIAGHMSYIAGTTAPKLWEHGIQAIGVYIFFILGGYLITQSWLLDSNPYRYAIKRFFRIWPPLAVFVILATFIVGPLITQLSFKEYFSSGALKYLENLVLYVRYQLPGCFASTPYPNVINGSLWTLPVEVLMYILLPILINICRIRSRSKKSVGVFIAITVLVCVGDIVMTQLYPLNRLVFYGTDWIQALHIVPFYFIGSSLAMIKIENYLSLPVSVVLGFLLSCFSFNYIVMHILLYFILPYFIL